MDNHQFQALSKLFSQRRLNSDVPEHKLFIESELARLRVLNPKDAENFAEFYGVKLPKKVDAPGDVPVTSQPETIVEEPVVPVPHSVPETLPPKEIEESDETIPNAIPNEKPLEELNETVDDLPEEPIEPVEEPVEVIEPKPKKKKSKKSSPSK